MQRSWQILTTMVPATLLGAAFLAPPCSANDDVILIQFLASTGQDANGTARARWRDKGEDIDFNVELEKLDAGSYDLYVADVLEGSIDVGEFGEGEIEFKTPLDDDKPLFDFEVFDQVIEVRQGDTVFFSDTFGSGGPGGGGGGGGGGGASKTEVFMVNVGPDGNAKGRLRYENKGDETRFKVNVENLDGAEYQLVVGGTVVADFDTTGFPEVELDFRSPPDDNPSQEDGEFHFELTFDPLGQQVDIVANETTYLTGVLPGDASKGSGAPKKAKQSAKDVGKKKGDALLVQLMDLGVLPGAEGKMKLEQTGETEFEVEIEDVGDGTYALFVGGVEVGSIVVEGGEGQINFSTSPEGDELLLDFDVKAQLVEVKISDETILAAVFPTSVQAALGTFKKEIVKDNLIVRNLVNTGFDLDATGKVRWSSSPAREKLTVNATDLPEGEHPVLVDGIERGTLVITQSDGKAKVVFDSKASGKGKKILLDFEVLGLTLQVLVGKDVALETIIE